MSIGTQNILIVDDTPANLMLLETILKEQGYTVRAAISGEVALRSCSRAVPDLILLDIEMPGLSGFDVINRLKSNPDTIDIPVIFLTARTEAGDETRGLELGAADYITKPICPAIVLARVKTQLENKSFDDFLRNQNSYLETEVEKRTRELSAIQSVMILAMASLAETRDTDTGNHIRRTQHYARALAEKMSSHPQYSSFLTPQNIDLLFKSAPLHDIGKVGIPDRILLKPDRLTQEEFDIIKSHATLGRDAIEHAEKQLGMPVEFLKLAKEVIYYHHEHWDGSGYPTGAAGEDIPISGRLMAVADVYDALTSRRVYKEAIPHAEAVEIIRAGKGSHFDPAVVDAFIELAGEFHEIAKQYADSELDMAAKTELFELLKGSPS